MASEVLMPSSAVGGGVALRRRSRDDGDRRWNRRHAGDHVRPPHARAGAPALTNAGLDTVAIDGDTITIGATTRVDALARARYRGAHGLCRQCRRRRDPLAGDRRRQPLRRPGARGAARRPARCAAGSRCNGPLGRPGRRAHGIARGVPPPPARPARPRRQLHPAGSLGLRGARVSAHARVHRARGLRRSFRRRHDPARGHRSRGPRRTAALGRGRGVGSGGGRSRGSR